MYAAVASSSKDSWAITWHQWQAAYPTLSSTGTPRSRASANASGDHSRQSTGLSWCCRRYGDVASARRLTIRPSCVGPSSAPARGPPSSCVQARRSTVTVSSRARGGPVVGSTVLAGQLQESWFASVNAFARATPWLHVPLRAYAEYGVVL